MASNTYFSWKICNDNHKYLILTGSLLITTHIGHIATDDDLTICMTELDDCRSFSAFHTGICARKIITESPKICVAIVASALQSHLCSPS